MMVSTNPLNTEQSLVEAIDYLALGIMQVMNDSSIVLAARGIAQHLLLTLEWPLRKALDTIQKRGAAEIIGKLLRCQSEFMGPTPRAIGIDLVTEAAASKIQQSLDVKHVKQQKLHAETVQVDRIKPHIKIDLLHTHPQRIWLRFYSTNPIFMLWLSTSSQAASIVQQVITNAVTRMQPQVTMLANTAVEKLDLNSDDDNNTDSNRSTIYMAAKRATNTELTRLVSKTIIAAAVSALPDCDSEHLQALANDIAESAFNSTTSIIESAYRAAETTWFNCTACLFNTPIHQQSVQHKNKKDKEQQLLHQQQKQQNLNNVDMDEYTMVTTAPFPYATTTIRVRENVYEIYLNDKNESNCMRLMKSLHYIGLGTSIVNNNNNNISTTNTTTISRTNAADVYKFDLIFCSELAMFLYSPLLFMSNYIKFMWCYTANRDIFDPRSFDDLRLLTSHTTYGLMFLNTNNLSSMPKTTHGPLIACSGERPKIALNKFDPDVVYINEGSRALQSVDKASDFGTVSNFIEIVSEIELLTDSWIMAIK